MSDQNTFIEAGNQYMKLSKWWMYFEAILMTILGFVLILIWNDTIKISDEDIDDTKKVVFAVVGVFVILFEWLWVWYVEKGKYGKGLLMSSGIGFGPVGTIVGFIYFNIIRSIV